MVENQPEKKTNKLQLPRFIASFIAGAAVPIGSLMIMAHVIGSNLPNNREDDLIHLLMQDEEMDNTLLLDFMQNYFPDSYNSLQKENLPIFLDPNNSRISFSFEVESEDGSKDIRVGIVNGSENITMDYTTGDTITLAIDDFHGEFAYWGSDELREILQKSPHLFDQEIREKLESGEIDTSIFISKNHKTMIDGIEYEVVSYLSWSIRTGLPNVEIDIFNRDMDFRSNGGITFFTNINGEGEVETLYSINTPYGIDLDGEELTKLFEINTGYLENFNEYDPSGNGGESYFEKDQYTRRKDDFLIVLGSKEENYAA